AGSVERVERHPAFPALARAAPQPAAADVLSDHLELLAGAGRQLGGVIRRPHGDRPLRARQTPDRYPAGPTGGGHEYELAPFAAALAGVDPLSSDQLQRQPVRDLMRGLGDDAGHD